MYKFIQHTIEKHTGYLILNRPEKKNAFHAEMISEITTGIKNFSQNNSLRAVIIKATGNCFSAGADLNYMKSMASYSKEENIKDSQALFSMFLSVYNCPIPVICLVKGASFGGANGIIASADYVIATEDAKFSFSEVNLGILPATISPFVVAKMGVANSMDLFLSGRKFNAIEAKELGLINQVCGLHQGESELLSYVNQILTSAPHAVRKTKALVRNFSSINPEDYMMPTSTLIAEARTGAEGQEGIMAFFEKRIPDWTK